MAKYVSVCKYVNIQMYVSDYVNVYVFMYENISLNDWSELM